MCKGIIGKGGLGLEADDSVGFFPCRGYDIQYGNYIND